MTTPTPGHDARDPDGAALPVQDQAGAGLGLYASAEPTGPHASAEPTGPHVSAEPTGPHASVEPTGTDRWDWIRTWRQPRLWAGEALAALLVALAVAALGFPLGWLWSALAPHVQVVITPDGPSHVDPEPESYIAGEGWYVLIAGATGVMTAALSWLLVRRRRGPVVLVALTVGAVVAGVVMAWWGHRIGLAHYERLLHGGPVGTRFDRPVDLRTKLVRLPRVQGAVLTEAIAAAATYTTLAAFSNAPSLGRVSSHWSVLPARPMAPAPPAPGSAVPPHG